MFDSDCPYDRPCPACTICTASSPLAAQPLATPAVLHDTAEGEQGGFQGHFHERRPFHGDQVASGAFNHIPDRLPLRHLLLDHQERVGSFFVFAVFRVCCVCVSVSVSVCFHVVFKF